MASTSAGLAVRISSGGGVIVLLFIALFAQAGANGQPEQQFDRFRADLERMK
jgi:hypothetical protein